MIRHRSPLSGVDTFGGEWVASAGYDNQVILWDAKTKTAVARAFHDHLANQCRFSPDGRYLVSASSDFTARLWSLPSLRLVAVFDGHKDDVEMAVVSPSGKEVATASRDRTVRIFDLQGRPRALLEGHEGDVNSVDWAAGGKELVSTSDDGTVRRWQADSGKLLTTIDLRGVQTDTVVSTDDGQIFAGNAGEIIALTGAGDVRARTHAHAAGIKRLAYERRTRRLLSASYDRTMKLWDIGAGGALELVHEAELPAPVWCRACAFTNTSLATTGIVFGTFGSSYATYDVATKRWDLSKIDPTPGVNAIMATTTTHQGVFTVGDAGIVRRDGQEVTEIGSLSNFLVWFDGLLLTGGHLGTLFDAMTGKALFQHRSPLNCADTFRRNGKDGQEQLIVATYTGEGLIFGRTKDGIGIELISEVRLHDDAVKGIAANDTHLFSVCATGAAAFHSIDRLELVSRIERGHDKIGNGAIRLPDGRFASVSRDRHLRIWSLGRADQIIPTPHLYSIKCLAALQHHRPLIATGAYDGTVAIYDVTLERWIHQERPTASGISCLCANPLNDGFLAGSFDGQVYPIVPPNAQRRLERPPVFEGSGALSVI